MGLPLQKFLEWACETGDSHSSLGPHSYEGAVRVFFAKMFFEKVIEAITISEFDDDVVSIQNTVSTAISSMFDTWKDDINTLRDRIVHDASYFLVKESKSLDVGSEKKKKKSFPDPPKKPKTNPAKKTSAGGAAGASGSMPQEAHRVWDV